MNISNRLESSGDESLGKQIYQHLRRKLIIGELQPGEAISIRKLAEEYSVSAMPVREALKQLALEGALIGAAKKAYRVPDLSAKKAADLFYVRAVLEGAGAEIAARVLKPADIDVLSRIVVKMDAAWVNADPSAFLSENFNFHSTIYSKTGNEDLRALVESLYVRTGPWLAYAIRNIATLNDWQSDHTEIIDALRDRDCDRARRLMEEDARWGMQLYGANEP